MRAHYRTAEREGWLQLHEPGHNGAQQTYHYVTPGNPWPCAQCGSRDRSRGTESAEVGTEVGTEIGASRDRATSPYVGTENLSPSSTYPGDTDRRNGRQVVATDNGAAGRDENPSLPRSVARAFPPPATALAAPASATDLAAHGEQPQGGLAPNRTETR